MYVNLFVQTEDVREDGREAYGRFLAGRLISRRPKDYSVAVIFLFASAIEYGAVVDQEEEYDEDENDADGESAGTVDGRRVAVGGQDVGEESRAPGGEEADEEEENQRKEHHPCGADDLLDRFRHRIRVAEDHRQHHHRPHHPYQDHAVGRHLELPPIPVVLLRHIPLSLSLLRYSGF
ncbi:unnamed protein product [Victoria cruziana]